MSLLVWLPFDGTLENKGTKFAPMNIYGSPTVDNNGKIGQCYSFNGTSDYLSFRYSIYNLSGYSTFSITYWCYTSTSMAGFFTIRRSSAHLLSIHSNGLSFRDTVHSSTITSINFELPDLSTWTHYAIVYNKGSFKIYKNGLLIKTLNYTSEASLKTELEDMRIGMSETTSGKTYFTGKVNDFRIYDHCLSPLEVKEVYLSLILHYKFDNNENIVPYNYIPKDLCHPVAIEDATELVINDVTTAGKYWTIPVDNAKLQFTLSAYIKNTTTGPLRVILGYKSLSDGSGFYSFGNSIAAGEEGWSTKTMDYSEIDDILTDIIMVGMRSSNNIFVSSLSNPSVALFLLEKGNTRTNFILGLCNTGPSLIIDSSGYNHNGSIYGNVLTAYDTSARYNQCIYIPSGNTDYIETLSTIGNPNDTITMNIWFKSSNTSPGNNYHEIFNIATGTLEYEVAISNTGYLRAGMHVNGSRVIQNTVLLNLLNGNWHMLTMTYDGAYVRRYVDGIKKIELSASGTIMSNCKFLFGHYGINTSYHAREAYLSDARVYATALDDNDIKNLYNISMKMDSLENIHAFNIKELGGKELIADEPLYTPYSSTTTPWTSYDSNGDIYMTGTCNLGTRKTIEINPTGSTYYYDFDISMNSGNRIYLLISRYDENFTSRSNDASVNIRYINASEDINHLHLYGTINLSTDTVNPCKYIKFRVLNGYTGSTAENPYLIIHSMSLREVKTLLSLKILKNGDFIVDTINEQNGNIQFFKSGMAKAAEFIER